MDYVKLDQSLKTVQERIDFVASILESLPKKPSSKTLEFMSNYIFAALSSKEQKKLGLISTNRQKTIDKRETSLDALTEKFENNEDSIYSLFSTTNHIPLTQKKEITDQDVENIAGLRELRKSIDIYEDLYKEAAGHDKYLLKKNIIEMRQDQYYLKSQTQNTGNILVKQRSNSAYTNAFSTISLDGSTFVDNCGDPQTTCQISLFNYKHVSAILCNYSDIKQSVSNQDDLYYEMIEFDRIAGMALEKYPMYEDIVTYKIDGITNAAIKEKLYNDYGRTYAVEYISKLWRQTIPKLIAEKAQEEFLLQWYTYVKRGKWKKCSRCGQIKLAHSRFFSLNGDSSDGFYSICKDCRSKKRRLARAKTKEDK